MDLSINIWIKPIILYTSIKSSIEGSQAILQILINWIQAQRDQMTSTKSPSRSVARLRTELGSPDSPSCTWDLRPPLPSEHSRPLFICSNNRVILCELASKWINN